MSSDLNNAADILQDALFRASPNCDERPPQTIINLLVIHGISLPPGEFGGSAVEDLFLNQLDTTSHPYFADLARLKVASHLFIRRTGELLQFVPFHKRAWHAGKSRFRGKENCNDFSIGIELEGTDDIPYTNAQYQCLAEITQALLRRYPEISLDNIVGHSDIAPGRKTDPGPVFDWQLYRRLLKEMR